LMENFKRCNLIVVVVSNSTKLGKTSSPFWDLIAKQLPDLKRLTYNNVVLGRSLDLYGFENITFFPP